MLDMENLAASLVDAIYARRLTIVELAEISGVNRTLIHRIKSGKPARKGTVEKLERALAGLPAVRKAA